MNASNDEHAGEHVSPEESEKITPPEGISPEVPASDELADESKERLPPRPPELAEEFLAGKEDKKRSRFAALVAVCTAIIAIILISVALINERSALGRDYRSAREKAYRLVETNTALVVSLESALLREADLEAKLNEALLREVDLQGKLAATTSVVASVASIEKKERSLPEPKFAGRGPMKGSEEYHSRPPTPAMNPFWDVPHRGLGCMIKIPQITDGQRVGHYLGSAPPNWDLVTLGVGEGYEWKQVDINPKTVGFYTDASKLWALVPVPAEVGVVVAESTDSVPPIPALD